MRESKSRVLTVYTMRLGRIPHVTLPITSSQRLPGMLMVSWFFARAFSFSVRNLALSHHPGATRLASGKRDSNPQPLLYKSTALTVAPFPISCSRLGMCVIITLRPTALSPTSSGIVILCEGSQLPLTSSGRYPSSGTGKDLHLAWASAHDVAPLSQGSRIFAFALYVQIDWRRHSIDFTHVPGSLRHAPFPTPP